MRTVKEIIEELSRFPPHHEVRVSVHASLIITKPDWEMNESDDKDYEFKETFIG